MFGSLWSRWTTTFKVVTPLLHVAFSATQMHGSYNFYKMRKRQQKFIREERDQLTYVIDQEQNFSVRGPTEVKEAAEETVTEKARKQLPV